MKYANQLNLLIALTGIGVLLYTLSLTFLAPVDSDLIDPAQLRQIGTGSIVLTEAGGALLMQDATTQLPAVDAARQRRDLQPSRTQESGARPGGGLVMPGAAQPWSGSDLAGQPAAPQRSPMPSVRPTQRSTVTPQRPATRTLPVGRRPPPVESSASGDELDAEGAPSGLVGAGGATRTGNPPPRGVVQPLPGAEVQKRDQPSEAPPPPYRSSMPARRPPE